MFLVGVNLLFQTTKFGLGELGTKGGDNLRGPLGSVKPEKVMQWRPSPFVAQEERRGVCLDEQRQHVIGHTRGRQQTRQVQNDASLVIGTRQGFGSQVTQNRHCTHRGPRQDGLAQDGIARLFVARQLGLEIRIGDTKCGQQTLKGQLDIVEFVIGNHIGVDVLRVLTNGVPHLGRNNLEFWLLIRQLTL